MSRNAKTAIAIGGIIAGAAVISILVYYIGYGVLFKIFLSDNGNRDAWSKYYASLVTWMGFLSVIISLAWYFISRFVLKVHYAFNVGKRAVWAIIGIVELVACIIAPYAMSAMHNGFKVSISIPILFIIFYGIIGYWIGSILYTPAPFKYTPIGAEIVRASKGRK